MDSLFQITGFVGTVAVWIAIVLTVGLHLLLAKAVADECFRMLTAGREPMMLGVLTWWLVVFLTGLIGLTLFWAMHFSSWRDPVQDRVKLPK